MKVLDRVRRGVARLDLIDPEWHTKVDHRRLHMWSMKDCVLGQLTDGRIDENLSRFGFESWEQLKEEGFVAHISNDWFEMNHHWFAELWSRPC